MNKLNVLDQFSKHRKDHKSTVFLYAILQFSKEICKPLNTYLHLNKHEFFKDRYLFTLFNPNQKGYKECKKVIESHELWDFCITDADGYDLHVFTFEKYFQYYDRVLAGDYANFRTEFKLILSRDNHPLSVIAMHPDEYHENYLKSFNVSNVNLPKGAQLILKPNHEDETINVSKEVLRQFQQSRGMVMGTL